MACRQRHYLNGEDAQALEGALQQVEMELEKCRADLERQRKGVKELVEKAYRAGFEEEDAGDCDYLENCVYEYMKALED
jgi:hypothetical protein